MKTDARKSPTGNGLLLAAWLCLTPWGSPAATADEPGPTHPPGALVEAEWLEDDAVFSRSLKPPTRFSIAHSREILSRAARLLERLHGELDEATYTRLDSALRKAQAGLLEGQAGLPSRVEKGELPEPARRSLYLDARCLLRRVAFANPLLDIERLLFIKRHDPGGVFHMCDQYYGFNARPGGGLFVLEEPFGPRPQVTNLLADSVVDSGRFSGKRLTPGSFLSPELSFDGKTILFAYTEAEGKDLEWSPTASYHIFRVNADGTGLTQITHGSWNDFDPCFLPGGRVAFISERRGGYLRCGRHCPTYTMHSMEPDGSDIIRLSFHETHEWHPSVDNDGLIVYTRWDYVDRDTNVAHHIWTCYPDGRDPRSFHGNYPVRREGRPWMEMSIRAIPGSRKYVATTGAHHGHAFGSLVIIDPALPDDGAMSQLERLTPDVPFPEAERHIKPIRECMSYATAWPLSEEDYLCVYDRHAKNRGIYWIDRAGNKELLYRDPEISSLSPIPFRPRPTPPVISEKTLQTAAARQQIKEDGEAATVGIINIYDSDFAWPEGSNVAALRVIQVLPKTTPPPNQPRIGVADQTNARSVLGTVPVESDGSIHFDAPPGRLLYFQALDERGLALQSMRSGTYLHPGERLVCRGCHEPKLTTSPSRSGMPLAFRRPPSRIQPDVDGSHPFSYVRLVQPALDRNCVDCHREKKATDLSGIVEGKHGWTRSYSNLAGKYGFFFHVSNGAINKGVHGGTRTVPGAFGALASPLLRYLGEEHHGLKLSEEDFHRITLWLDANSEFYGSYENTQAQARGEVVQPTMH